MAITSMITINLNVCVCCKPLLSEILLSFRSSEALKDNICIYQYELLKSQLLFCKRQVCILQGDYS